MADLSTHWLARHPLRTFVIMLCCSLVFGLGSYNLFYLLKANLVLVLDYGVMALVDGALQELVMLAVYGTVSLSAYILFKACEKTLVEWVLSRFVKPVFPRKPQEPS